MHRNIKVAMYVPNFLPYRGGTELATHYLAMELDKSCHVEIYTLNHIPILNKKEHYGIRTDSGLPEEDIIDGIRVHRFSVTNLPILKGFSLPLVRDVSSSDVDIVHFQGAHRLASRLLVQKFTRGKIKVLTTHALHESVAILRRKGYSPISSLFVRSLSKMDHIIGLSQIDRRLLLSLGIPNEKISVITNGIDPDKFKRRRAFVQKNEKLKILCVARFARNKNYELLIEVLSQLRKSVDFQAIFVGDFDTREYFAKILSLIRAKGLESYVQIALGLDDAALTDCYLSSDIFVLASFMETLPLVILEAMYAGLPIVATRVGGIPEIVKDGVNGFLVPPNDSEELFQKCFQLLKDEKLRTRIRNANLSAASKYTWDKIASSTIDLYKRLLG